MHVCQAAQTQYILNWTHHSASISTPTPKLSLPPVFFVSVNGTTMNSVTQARNLRVIPNFTLLFQSALESCQFLFQNITGIHPLLSISIDNTPESCHCHLSWGLQKQPPNWFLHLQSHSPPTQSSFCSQNLSKITALLETFKWVITAYLLPTS